jgi:site-specific recombinase XerD
MGIGTPASRARRHGMGDMERLLTELEAIRDVYRLDVKQFIWFIRERKLALVEGLAGYAKWLEEDHAGKRYSPATINRKISAAKSRIRYAFKRSASAESLRKKHQLEDVLRTVRLKKINAEAASAAKALRIDQVKKLVGRTKDDTVRLMVAFLCGTGVRVSEMLGIRLSDMKAGKGIFVEVRILGRGSRERMINVKKGFIERIRKHFNGTTYLFEHQGRRFNRISVTNRIKHEALKTIGREVTASQLRHTWAKIQIRRGGNVKAIAEVLGHSDPGSTLRMYEKADLKPEEAFLDLEEGKGKQRS